MCFAKIDSFVWHKMALNPSKEMESMYCFSVIQVWVCPSFLIFRWPVPDCSVPLEPRTRTWRRLNHPLPDSRGGPGLRAETPGRRLSLRTRAQKSRCLPSSLWRRRLPQPQKQVQCFGFWTNDSNFLKFVWFARKKVKCWSSGWDFSKFVWFYSTWVLQYIVSAMISQCVNLQ